MNLVFMESGEFSVLGLIDFIVCVLILGAFCFLTIKIFKRKLPIILLHSFSAGIIISTFFSFKYLQNLLVVALAVCTIIIFIANLGQFRTWITNKYEAVQIRKKELKKAEVKIAKKEVNREQVYKTVNEAVLYLAKHKIGAIITFERKDNLDNILKNGSLLHSPITYELLITIFYPGTRLHDGAVIIRADEIIAASVYYTPTTKPLIGKYGSRHRAAIGISEICDAVTVVVSEETGRISIAHDGEIEGYGPDSFYKALENIMEEDNDENKEKEE